MSLTSLNDLTDPQARALVSDWFDRFKACFPGQPEACEEACAALEAHLIDAVGGEAAANAERVKAALDQLGDPADLAADWAGPQRLELAGPRSRWKDAVLSTVRALGLVVGALLLIASVARLVDPGSVGVVQLTNGTIVLGTINAREVAIDYLGPWTAPVFGLIGAFSVWISLRGKQTRP